MSQVEKFSFNSQPRLRFLSDEQIVTVHQKALEVLERAGIYFESAKALEILDQAGASVDFDKGIVKFKSEMIEKAIQKVPNSFPIYDREGEYCFDIGGDHVHFDPGSATIRLLESDGITVRSTRAQDMVDISRLVSVLPNIAMQATAVTPYDIPEMIGDSFRLYLLLKNCKKPLISGAFTADGIPRMRDLLLAVRGSDAALREKPLAIFDICSSSPLKWTNDSCQNLIDCARFGLPIETISVPMFGAISPATLSGSLIMHTAETLSGIALAQTVSPGTPMVYGGAPMYFDMRFSTTSLNAMEAEMVSVGYSQMAKYYGMPTHTYAGLADAKTVNAQAGLETGMSATVAVLGGINNISGPGALDFVNTFSLEKLVIDDEICGQALRLHRGIDFSEEAMAVDLMCDLGPGGEYISSEHTMQWFKKEPYLPSSIIDRKGRDAWEEEGSSEIFDRAAKKVASILASDAGEKLDSARDAALDAAELAIEVGAGHGQLPCGPKH